MAARLSPSDLTWSAASEHALVPVEVRLIAHARRGAYAGAPRTQLHDGAARPTTPAEHRDDPADGATPSRVCGSDRGATQLETQAAGCAMNSAMSTRTRCRAAEHLRTKTMPSENSGKPSATAAAAA
jgi:hypothetical protein